MSEQNSKGGLSPNFHLADSIHRDTANVSEFELPKAVEAAKRIAGQVSEQQKTIEDQRQYIIQLEDVAGTDYDTRLPDKHSWNTELEERIMSGKKVGIAVVDLTNFKAINDKKGGHLVGDDALMAAADLLLVHGTRDEDFVARIGGDEFGVILDLTAREGEELSDEERLEKFRQNTNERIGNYARLTTFDDVGYGASMGLAVYTPGETVRELFERAENDMYNQKAQQHAERGQHRS